jgi:hypothetical protein
LSEFDALKKELAKYPILPKEKGPYTFEEKDGVVYMKNKHGSVCARMPKDVYDDILKQEAGKT